MPDVRAQSQGGPTILHVDLDAFFASVEQRDKPSLRGKPVVVGGTGPRGVVATASYEARAFGVHSAMPTAEARRRCPNAAFLAGRFDAYREASVAVMTVLDDLSPAVEPLSLDEAYVDLAAAGPVDTSATSLARVGTDLQDRIATVTGGLGCSVGIATSKLIAKIASDIDKPHGLVVVPAGQERDLIRPMQVSVIPGVGPATTERLRRVGVRTVAELEQLSVDELVRELGQAHGRALFALARAEDDRLVTRDRETKSVSVEDTYDTDHTDARLLTTLIERQAHRVSDRLQATRLSGRTVTVKIRLHDFSTHTRSATLPAPTDDRGTITRLARTLLTEVDTSGGVRLLGVGVSGLADWVQDDLFEAAAEHADPGDLEDPAAATGSRPGPSSTTGRDVPPLGQPLGQSLGDPPRWPAGADVVHAVHGRGWVWGAGRGVVTVRFETRETPPGELPGRVRSLPADDPALIRWRPPPAVPDDADVDS